MSERCQFENLLRNRRSVRRFKAEPPSKVLISRIIESAIWAPSAGNRQAWEFVVVLARKTLQAMAAVVRVRWNELLVASDSGAAEELKEYSRKFDWFSAAPAVVVVLAKEPDAFLEGIVGADAADVGGLKLSAGLAVENLMLAAHAHGVGSCCLTGPLVAQAELKQLLGLSKRRTLVCLIALGFSAEEPVTPSRKPVDKVMRFVE